MPKTNTTTTLFLFAATVLFLLIRAHVNAQTPSPTPSPTAIASPVTSPTPVPEPKVTGIEGNLQLDDLIKVNLEGLKEWAETEQNDLTKLVPYINGLAIRGNYPQEIHASKNHLQFHLEITPDNKQVWIDLLGEPHQTRRAVAFSVGFENQAPFDSVIDQTHPAMLTVISPVYGLIAL